MTLQDLIDLLLAGDSKGIPRDVAIARAILLAYELGLEHGRKEAQALARMHVGWARWQDGEGEGG